MQQENLIIRKQIDAKEPQLVMGFTGWMNGGDVSTGTIDYLIRILDVEEIAEIKSDGYYLYNFPGTMETASIFRPYCRIVEGTIQEYDLPTNTLFYNEQHNIILFAGNEPNINWTSFGDCVFSFCENFGVKKIVFTGSVAGLVPHTREPWIMCSVSDDGSKNKLEKFGVRFTNYEGPSSFITYLMTEAPGHSIEMINLIATIPAYVQGYNPTGIESIMKKLTAVLGIHLDLADLQSSSDDFEKKLSNVVNEQPELAESIIKLEQDYDNEVFDSEMGDLKRWLHQQGIRVD
jgi:predicted ATP-grasp superfamily ATP-dependent carboligase